MTFDPECVPCIVKQAYRAAKMFTDGDKELQLKIVKEVCREVESIGSDYTAPLFSTITQSIVERNTGVPNPYREMKRRNLRKAERYVPYLQAIVDGADDALQAAVRVAIAGNTIDVAANPDFTIEDEVARITTDEIDLSAYSRFSEDCRNAKLILYIGDNYEEALFDRILLTMLLPGKVVFAVRSRPILNDITLEDALRIGIDRICPIVESGSTIAGTDLSHSTPEFAALYRNADVVIAKGQGNYETLMNETRPIYFLLKIKCGVIARRTGLEVGTSALLFSGAPA